MWTEREDLTYRVSESDFRDSVESAATADALVGAAMVYSVDPTESDIALGFLDRAMQISPSHPLGNLVRSYHFWMIGADDLLRRGLQLVGGAVDDDPKMEGVGRLMLVRLQGRLEDWYGPAGLNHDAAFTRAMATTESEPTWVDNFLELCTACRNIDRDVEAERALDQAINNCLGDDWLYSQPILDIAFDTLFAQRGSDPARVRQIFRH